MGLGRFNRPSNNRLDDALADQVIKILRSTYADFEPTLATEKLRTRHGIDLAKQTVRRLQIAGGLWIPRKLRPPKIQQPRQRRACLGELVQIGGCEHHWFEDRTQFGRALYELNIQGICANTPAANAFMATYVPDYNALFGKVPCEAHDAHRAIREDEDLDQIFTWREQRKVTANLTLHYERKLYLLADTPQNRGYAGKYLDVY